MADNNSISRRGFLDLVQKLIAATGVAAIIGPIIAFFWPADLEEVPSEPVAVGPEDSIPVGTAKTVRYGRYPAIVLNTEEGLRAYSAVCTHFACIVTWQQRTIGSLAHAMRVFSILLMGVYFQVHPLNHWKPFQFTSRMERSSSGVNYDHIFHRCYPRILQRIE